MLRASGVFSIIYIVGGPCIISVFGGDHLQKGDLKESLIFQLFHLRRIKKCSY